MANNDTDVPRCPVCGQFMELLSEGRRTATYECCEMLRTVIKPGFRRGDPTRGERRGV